MEPVRVSTDFTAPFIDVTSDPSPGDIGKEIIGCSGFNESEVEVKKETSFTLDHLFDELFKKGSIVYGSKSQSDVDGGESMCATAVALSLISLLSGDISFDIDSILKEARTKYWALIHYLKGKNFINPAEDYYYGKLLTWLQDILPKDPPRLLPALQRLEHLTGKINKLERSKSFQSMIDEMVLKIPKDETQVGGCLMIGVLFCAIAIKRKEDFLEIHFFDSHKCPYLRNSAYHVFFQGPNASEHLADFLALRFSEYSDIDYYLDLVRLDEKLIDKNEIPPLNLEEQAAILCEILLNKESNKKEFLENELFPFLQKNLPDVFKQLAYRLVSVNIIIETSNDPDLVAYFKTYREENEIKVDEDIKDLTKSVLEMTTEQFRIIFSRFIEKVLRKDEFVRQAERIKEEILVIRDKLKSDKEGYAKNEIQFRKDRIVEIWEIYRVIESVRKKIDDPLFEKIRDEFLSLLLTHLYTSSSVWDSDKVTIEHILRARLLLRLVSDSFEGDTKEVWQKVSLEIEKFYISVIEIDCHSESLNEKAINLFTRFAREERWARFALLKQILFFLKENLNDAYKELCERFIPMNINITVTENAQDYDDLSPDKYLMEHYTDAMKELTSYLFQQLGMRDRNIPFKEIANILKEFRQMKNSDLSSFFILNEDVNALSQIIMGVSDKIRNDLLKLFMCQVLKKESNKNILNDLENHFAIWLSDSDRISKHADLKEINKKIQEIREYEKQNYLDDENLLLFKKIESSFLEQLMTDLEALVFLQEENKDKISLKEINALGRVIEEGKNTFDQSLLKRWDDLLVRVNKLQVMKDTKNQILPGSQESAVLTLVDKLRTNTEESYPGNVEFIFRFLKTNLPETFSKMCDRLTPVNLMIMRLQFALKVSLDAVVMPFLTSYPEITEFIFVEEVKDNESLIRKLLEVRDSDNSQKDSLFFQKAKSSQEFYDLMMLIPRISGSLILRKIVGEIIGENKILEFKNRISLLKTDIIKSASNPFDLSLEIYTELMEIQQDFLDLLYSNTNQSLLNEIKSILVDLKLQYMEKTMEDKVKDNTHEVILNTFCENLYTLRERLTDHQWQRLEKIRNSGL